MARPPLRVQSQTGTHSPSPVRDLGSHTGSHLPGTGSKCPAPAQPRAPAQPSCRPLAAPTLHNARTEKSCWGEATGRLGAVARTPGVGGGVSQQKELPRGPASASSAQPHPPWPPLSLRAWQPCCLPFESLSKVPFYKSHAARARFGRGIHRPVGLGGGPPQRCGQASRGKGAEGPGGQPAAPCDCPFDTPRGTQLSPLHLLSWSPAKTHHPFPHRHERHGLPWTHPKQLLPWSAQEAIGTQLHKHQAQSHHGPPGTAGRPPSCPPPERTHTDQAWAPIPPASLEVPMS